MFTSDQIYVFANDLICSCFLNSAGDLNIIIFSQYLRKQELKWHWCHIFPFGAEPNSEGGRLKDVFC